VQINTGRTTIDEAASMIEQLVRVEQHAGAEAEDARTRGAGAIA
jgi:hypothetical protein